MPRACEAALEMQAKMLPLKKEWENGASLL